jgi:hypothetical protein
MGLMGRILGLGRTAEQLGSAVGGVAEVFVGNRAEREAAVHERARAALEQFAGEGGKATGRFDGFVDGLNRLPRPMLALGTLALFVYAMAEPVGFGRRMQGLELVPEPLWWLLGAIVSFYFGARELHHHRNRGRAAPASAAPAKLLSRLQRRAAPAAAPVVEVDATDPDYNAAVEEWRRTAA